MKIDGNRAVITGGASGIGRAIAKALVARDCRVIIVDLDAQAALACAAELGSKALAMTCDVRDVASVDAMAVQCWEQLGGVDLVFANAGVCPTGMLINASATQFDLIYQINVRGSWATAVAFARIMIAQERSGHICVTGSEHAVGVPHSGAGQYTASKHAVLGWADVLRGELPDTIGITVLCPGIVATGLHDTNRFEGADRVDEKQIELNGKLLGMGMPASQVAEMALRGIEDRAFLVPTHAASYPASRKRAEEMEAAFRTYADIERTDPSQYHLSTILKAVKANAKGK